MPRPIHFTHAGANVEITPDDGFGCDWTAVVGGVLIAKGWIRGGDEDAREAIIALLRELDFEQHVSKAPRYLLCDKRRGLSPPTCGREAGHAGDCVDAFTPPSHR